MNKHPNKSTTTAPTELQGEALDAVNGGYVVTQDLQDRFRKDVSGETRLKPEDKGDGKIITAGAGDGSI